jgi:two-component system response regulator YesN
MAYNILLVDDDEEFREEFREFLFDYKVIEASGGREALDILSRPNEIDLVILDVVMPGLPGTEVLRRIKAAYPDLAVIILTGHGSKQTVIDALKGRADDYIEKPVEIPKARKVIHHLLEMSTSPVEAVPGSINVKIKKVMQFVDRNYDKRVSLKDAAELVALSPKYLSRLFRQSVGIGFSQYRVKARMEKAVELLEVTDYTIAEISYKLGYENPESFTRTFAKIVGCAPTEYRAGRRSPRSGGGGTESI